MGSRQPRTSRLRRSRRQNSKGSTTSRFKLPASHDDCVCARRARKRSTMHTCNAPTRFSPSTIGCARVLTVTRSTTNLFSRRCPKGHLYCHQRPLKACRTIKTQRRSLRLRRTIRLHHHCVAQQRVRYPSQFQILRRTLRHCIHVLFLLMIRHHFCITRQWVRVPNLTFIRRHLRMMRYRAPMPILPRTLHQLRTSR